MARKDQLAPVDEAEEEIRNNPSFYSVVTFIPPGKREREEVPTLEQAMRHARTTLESSSCYRSAMVYAVREIDERSALVGTMGRDLIWKQTMPKMKKRSQSKKVVDRTDETIYTGPTKELERKT